MDIQDKICITGRSGLVGNAIYRCLKEQGYNHIIAPSRAELDLPDETATQHFMAKENPQYVFAAAAKTGGIAAQLQEPLSFL